MRGFLSFFAEEACLPKDDLRCRAAFWILRIILPILVVTGTVGNILNIMVLSRKAFRSKPILILIPMALSDIIVLWVNAMYIVYWNVSQSNDQLRELFAKTLGQLLIFSSGSSNIVISLCTMVRMVHTFLPHNANVFLSTKRTLRILAVLYWTCGLYTGFMAFGYQHFNPYRLDSVSTNTTRHLTDPPRNLTDVAKNLTRNLTDPAKDPRRNLTDPAKNLAKPERNLSDQTMSITDPTRNITNHMRNMMNVKDPTSNLTNAIRNITDPIVNMTYPMENLNESTRNSTDPARNLTDPTRNLTDPIRNLTDPTRNLTDPIRNLTDPTRNLTDPTRNLTDPIRNLTDPTRNLTDPIRNLTDPTRNLTDPTRNLTDPTRNLTDPTRNLTDPTRNLTDAFTNLTYRMENLTDASTNLTYPRRILSEPESNLTECVATSTDFGKYCFLVQMLYIILFIFTPLTVSFMGNLVLMIRLKCCRNKVGSTTQDSQTSILFAITGWLFVTTIVNGAAVIVRESTRTNTVILIVTILYIVQLSNFVVNFFLYLWKGTLFKKEFKQMCGEIRTFLLAKTGNCSKCCKE